MAEIRIEHKKKAVWPWVIALVVAISLIAVVIFWQVNDSDSYNNMLPDTESVEPANPSALPN